MEIHYCAKCRSRVSSFDIEDGQGTIAEDGSVYCAKCARELGIPLSAAQPSREAKKAVTTVRKTVSRTARAAERPRDARRPPQKQPPAEQSRSAGVWAAVGGIFLLVLFMVFFFSGGNGKKHGPASPPSPAEYSSPSTVSSSGSRPVSSRPPLARDDSVETPEDVPVLIRVLENDSDPDGGPLRILNTGVADNGAVRMRDDGTIEYTPVKDFHGTDSFVYTVIDESGNTSRATVRVRVTPVNDPPAVEDIALSVRRGKPAVIVLHAADPEGDPLSYTVVSKPTHGTLEGVPPRLTYTPAENFSGTDEFTWKVTDGKAVSRVVAVHITVKAAAEKGEKREEEKKHPAVAAGLVAYWPFDEGEGRKAHDASGNGHTLLLRKGARWAEGKKGKAVFLDGVDDVLVLEDPTAPSLHSRCVSFTAACWIALAGKPEGPAVIFEEGGATYGMMLAYRPQAGKLVFAVRMGKRYREISSKSAFEPAAERWIHVAGVFDRGKMQLFVNGTLEAATEDGPPLVPSHSDNPGVGGCAGAVCLGQGKGRKISSWHGRIDEFRLYRRALSPAEVAELASSGKEAGKEEPRSAEAAPVHVKINFQPADVAPPEGYLVDAGEPFGDRKNGFSYGWSKDMTGNVRKRGKTPDVLKDTLIHLPRRMKACWEIALPPGRYRVTLSVGDSADSWHGVTVEGVVFWKSVFLEAGKFLEKTETVEVKDGRLTLRQGTTGGLWSRLNYIRIDTVEDSGGK